jgi:hypothetical protein
LPSSLDAEIRAHLCRYLAGETTLAELEDWLVPATWDVRRSDPGTEQLASTILLHLAEHSDGWLTEDALRTLLRPLVDPVPSAV